MGGGVGERAQRYGACTISRARAGQASGSWALRAVRGTLLERGERPPSALASSHPHFPPPLLPSTLARARWRATSTLPRGAATSRATCTSMICHPLLGRWVGGQADRWGRAECGARRGGRRAGSARRCRAPPSAAAPIDCRVCREAVVGGPKCGVVPHVLDPRCSPLPPHTRPC